MTASAKTLRALREAFAAGEQWGVTYSTWFEPSKEDTEREANEAITRILETAAHAAAKAKREKGK